MYRILYQLDRWSTRFAVAERKRGAPMGVIASILLHEGVTDIGGKYSALSSLRTVQPS